VTKGEANYRLPPECCAKCQHSYLSSYDDFQCARMTGVVIDLGGVCDLFLRDIGDQTCANCKHSEQRDKPFCSLQQDYIVDVDKACIAWSEDNNG
jgi:hypothetical protein